VSRRTSASGRDRRDERLRGPKKCAKTDWTDARHLRELLMIKRLPESWIPPDHIVDLRARVRLRHTLSHQRGEWQQRIQAVLYHHGFLHKRDLMTAEGRAWLGALPLPGAALEQITVAIAVIDALDMQLAPINKELRAYARRQTGCKALMSHYGIGPLTAVTILAELGDARRFSSSRDAVRYAGLDITVKQSDQRRAPGASLPPGSAGVALGALRRRPDRAAQAAPTTITTPRPPSGSAATACLALSRKLLKRSYHTLREAGEEALTPA